MAESVADRARRVVDAAEREFRTTGARLLQATVVRHVAAEFEGFDDEVEARYGAQLAKLEATLDELRRRLGSLEDVNQRLQAQSSRLIEQQAELTAAREAALAEAQRLHVQNIERGNALVCIQRELGQAGIRAGAPVDGVRVLIGERSRALELADTRAASYEAACEDRAAIVHERDRLAAHVAELRAALGDLEWEHEADAQPSAWPTQSRIRSLLRSTVNDRPSYLVAFAVEVTTVHRSPCSHGSLGGYCSCGAEDWARRLELLREAADSRVGGEAIREAIRDGGGA